MAFVKGQSGNPSGRPKINEEFRSRCRIAVDKHVIGAWIAEVETMGQHWPRCSELLAAYGYGRPTQPISGEDGGPLQVQIQRYALPENGRDKK